MFASTRWTIIRIRLVFSNKIDTFDSTRQAKSVSSFVSSFVLSLVSSSISSSVSSLASSLVSSLSSSISWDTKSNFQFKQLNTLKLYLIIHDLFRKFDSLRIVVSIPQYFIVVSITLYTKTSSSVKMWSWTKELELRSREWTNNRDKLNVASILYANQSQLAESNHVSTRTSPSFSFDEHLLRYRNLGRPLSHAS